MRTPPRFLLLVVALLFAGFTTGCPDDDDGDGNGDDDDAGNQDGGTVQQQIDESTQAHQQYEDLAVALEDGYTGPAHYVVNPEGEGAMGVHLLNRDVEGIDPNEAPVVVYQLDEEGQYQLGALEWIAPTEEFDEPPELFGEPFKGPFQVEGQPERYEHHAWFFIDNPDGQFARFNPAVEPPSYADDLNALVEATAPYRDVEEATADGYESTEECVVNPDDDSEAMGVHYVNPDITEIDPANPNALVYEPTGEGERLVAAEWVVPADQVEEAPEAFGQTFKGPFQRGEGEPEQYELHVWMGQPNPNGLFAQWNPTVACP